MIVITQFIYLHEDKEALFLEFEDIALPLLRQYGGSVLHRIRPKADSWIEGDDEPPYEIHILSFPSEGLFQNFLQAPERQASLHLKEESVRRIFTTKGISL